MYRRQLLQVIHHQQFIRNDMECGTIQFAYMHIVLNWHPTPVTRTPRSNRRWMLPTQCTMVKPPLESMHVASHAVPSTVLAAAYTAFLYVGVPLPKS